MEREIIVNPELTGQAQNAYSSGRGNFMPEGNVSPDLQPPASKLEQSSQHATGTTDSAELRKDWNSMFSSGELKDPGTRSTIQMMVDMGISPEKITSKGNTEQKAEDVIKTSLISSNQERIKRAEELLGVEKMSEEQAEAVLEAHFAGEGSVYIYSKKDLLEKARILEKAGFTKEQRRLLIEAGIAAEPPTDGGAPADPASAEARLPRPDVGTSTADAVDGSSAQGPELVGQKFDELIDVIKSGQQIRRSKDRAGIERDNINRILSWDPKHRQKYFDEIFRGLDARPLDLSQEIYGQLTEPYRKFQDFISAIAEGAYGDDDTITYEVEKDGEVIEKTQALDRQGLQSELRRFQALEAMNVALHDLSAVLYRPDIKFEQINGFIARMDSKTADLAFGYKGVEDMMNFYEFAIRESMALNNGYLDPRKMRGEITTRVDDDGNEHIDVGPAEIEERAKELFKRALKEGRLKQRTRSGNEVELGKIVDAEGNISHNLEDWEVERVFTVARGMMIASQATIVLAAESQLPKGHARSGSGFLQDIIQSYSPLRHLNSKWEIASEALAAFLVEGKSGDSAFDSFFKRFDPKELKEAWARFQDDPEKMLSSLTNVYYLGRENANYAGDIWTFVSWRADLNPETESAIKGLLTKGREKQTARWDEQHRGRIGKAGSPTAAEYIAFLGELESTKLEMSEEEFHKSTKKQREEFKEKVKHQRAAKIADWERAHQGAASISEFEQYWNEYQNWTGTAFLLEKQRGKLKFLGSDEHEKREEGKKAGLESMKIIERIVELQPHRLFSKSRYIRGRIFERLGIKGELDENQKEDFEKRLEDLQLVESAMLNSREELLEQGITFEKIDLNAKLWIDKNGNQVDAFELALGDVKDEDGNVIISAAERIRKAKELAGWVKEDYESNQNRIGEHINENGLYWTEFVKNREYTHGFVLWRGDIPVSEYDSSAVGPTGPIIRRGRDNENQELAGKAVTTLMDNLKHVKTQEDLIKLFDEIFAPVDHYNRELAKQVVADILPRVQTVFREDSRFMTIPFFRHLKLANRKSYARMVYGHSAPAWSVGEINYITEEIGHHFGIDHELIKQMQKDAGARNAKAFLELGTSGIEVLMVLFILGLISVTREGFKDVDGI